MVCGGGVYCALSQVWLLTGAAVELLWRNEQPQIISTERQSRLKLWISSHFCFITLNFDKALMTKSSDWSTQKIIESGWDMWSYLINIYLWPEPFVEDLSIDSLKNSPDCQLDRTGRVLARLEPSICGDVGPSITRDVSVELNILLNCKLGSNLNLTCSDWTISRLLFRLTVWLTPSMQSEDLK